MQLSAYQPHYFQGLLRTISAANQVDGANLGTSSPELQHVLARQPEDTVCVAVSGSSVAGYVRLERRAAAGEKPDSIVCLGIVHPEYRRQGIGTALVKWAIERSREIMQSEPYTFLIPVRHSVHGLQQLVENLNMRPAYYFHVLQYGNLPALPVVSEPAPGTLIRAYQGQDDIPAYTQCLNTVFAQQTSEQSVQQVVEEPGFDPSLWFFAFTGAKLVGFCTCTGYQYEGEVEYLGVLPEYRGRGLGLSLLSHGVRALAAKGYDNIHLAVNVSNERALGIYKQAGFREWRKSTTYMLEDNPNI